MAEKRYKTDYPGVRYKEHATRKHGVMKDRYFSIRYRVEGKLIEEGIGWASKGMTSKKANALLAELQENHRRGEGASTLREKQKIAQAIREKKDKEEAQQEKENTTFGTFWHTHYRPHSIQDKKESSTDREDFLYKLWIAPILADKRIKDITHLLIEKIKKQMKDAGQSKRSIEYALAVTRQVFNHALSSGYFRGENPTAKVKWPTVNNARLRYITKQEAEKLLGALKLKSPQVYEMSLLSLHCGLRFSEIASLQWQDVHLDEGFLSIRDPKNTISRISIMTTSVKAMFQGMKKGKPGKSVFLSTKEGKIDRISRTFDRTVKELGLNDGITDRRLRLTFHSLRHSYASFLAMQNVPILTIKEALGHKSLAMAMRYSHLAPSALKETARIVEETLTQSIIENDTESENKDIK
jgi:integrase